MFGWLYKRVAAGVIQNAVSLLDDKEFCQNVLNPTIDAIIDRQFSRMEGRIGGLANKMMPKMDIVSLLYALATKALTGGTITKTDQQELNSSSPNRLNIRS